MFQENLKTLRKNKGITQEELAARLNVVRQTISKWEKGQSVPDAEMLAKLAEIFEVPVSQLLGSRIEPDAQPDALAEQLARINEQLVIKNRRAKRIWTAIAVIVAGAMKKVLRWVATVLAVCIVTIVLNLLVEGVPLLGTPKVENIDRVVVTHTSYPDDIKEITDEYYIELAEAMLGYLHYAPLKGLSEDVPVIQITYIMDDGTEVVVKANEKTVWWNGKPHAIHDEGQFVKMCTAVFYLQNSQDFPN